MTSIDTWGDMPEVGRGAGKGSLPVSTVALRRPVSTSHVAAVRRAPAPTTTHSLTRTHASGAVGSTLAVLQVRL
jgi:hypothetical protein